MALKYSPESVGIAQLAGSCDGVGSIALNSNNAILSRIRASIEAVVTWHVIESQKEVLAEQNVMLLNTYQTEMKSISCLTQMELIGLRIDKCEMNKLITTIQEQMGVLQQQAFTYAGRRFSFTSSNDVAKVIGIYRGKRVSTNKQTLEQNESPISNLVLQWRKLSCTLTKMLFPIMRSITNDRIHGCSVTHTSTGRITMHEPNLQNVPRNFQVHKSDGSVVSVSVRGTLIPTAGKVFLSADYCQLELRLLAHLAQDSVLCNIMRIGNDVFKLIAANLNKVPESEVTDALRQRAKQLCYGIIYGMGTKALAEQLGSSEEEAAEFMVSFKNTYPTIQSYIQRVIELCRENGYVETLAGRRRYLPHITNSDPATRSQAERQAVNTTVQGSAADIAKQAMVSVDLKLRDFFPSQEDPNKSRVALVLHLHDELMYEVPIKDLKPVTKIVKCAMEQAVKLSIPFPVKLKSGPSWGQLQEIII
ncbi:DNA polymerase theta [Carabus blaptoides fortunei]